MHGWIYTTLSSDNIISCKNWSIHDEETWGNHELLSMSKMCGLLHLFWYNALTLPLLTTFKILCYTLKFSGTIPMSLWSSGRTLTLTMLRVRVGASIKALWGLVSILLWLSNNWVEPVYFSRNVSEMNILRKKKFLGPITLTRYKTWDF